jgi:hypothetical protein
MHVCVRAGACVRVHVCGGGTKLHLKCYVKFVTLQTVHTWLQWNQTCSEKCFLELQDIIPMHF